MDVIVDTNVLASDFRMQRNRFANLFDYLRRTDSALVLCKVVWDEVLAEYSEKLKGDIERVQSACDSLRESAFSNVGLPILPNRDEELRFFESSLRNPAKGVKVMIYSDYAGVDINEVVRRGVHRVRPASKAGEELRDVILWLQVIDYAKKKGSRVAFISHDATFIDESEIRETKGKNRKLEEEQEDTEKEYHLHSHLQSDLTNSSADVLYYRYLLAFNRSNTLTSHPVSRDWLSKLGPWEALGSNVREKISALLAESHGYFFGETIQEVSIGQLEFEDGKVHDIDESTQFAEIRFRAQVDLVLEPIIQDPNVSIYGSIQLPAVPSTRNFVYPFVPGGGVSSYPYAPSVFGPDSLYPPTGRTTRRVTLSAKFTTSTRLQGDRMSGLEIDNFVWVPEPSNQIPTLNYIF